MGGYAAEAERQKRAIRLHWAAACRDGGMSAETFLRLSAEVWAEYEEVNRRYLEADPTFTGTRAGVTLTTSADLWTLTSASAGQLRILESYIGGEATASTVTRIAVQRSTGGTTPTNQTPEKMNSRSPSAGSTFATNWSAQPTLSGNPFILHAFNAFGGSDRWVPAPGEEFYLVNAEQVSCRSAAGTPVVSAHVIFEEL